MDTFGWKWSDSPDSSLSVITTLVPSSALTVNRRSSGPTFFRVSLCVSVCVCEWERERVSRRKYGEESLVRKEKGRRMVDCRRWTYNTVHLNTGLPNIHYSGAPLIWGRKSVLTSEVSSFQ